jgi:hypothetical protein
VYKPLKDIHDNGTDVGITRICYYDREGSQAILTGNDSENFLVFRGTSERVDLLDDLDYVKCDFGGYAGGRVHCGFYRSLLRIWPYILSDLKKLDQEMPLWFTGHSLGAAMAVMATGMDSSVIPTHTYTFGCPRAGNMSFVRGLDTSKITRFENKVDVVTRLPPITSLRIFLRALMDLKTPSLYHHAGGRVELSTHGHGILSYVDGIKKLLESGGGDVGRVGGLSVTSSQDSGPDSVQNPFSGVAMPVG